MKKIKIVIVGAGFGGLCMGIKLKQAGIDDFLILEKANDLGGTWRENTYPGAECDIPSALYSYSFEHNSQWEFKWSGQAQILQYQRDTAAKYGLLDHIVYQQEVQSAEFNESSKEWLLKTRDGSQFQAQHFVCAIGQLNKPSTPKFENVEAFKGTTFHSASWDHSVDLAGKRVAVIGNAASAVQFIPEVAKVAKQLTVYQRSPNWVLFKFDRAYTKWEQKISAKFNWVTKAYRWCLWALGEHFVLRAIDGKPISRWIMRKLCLFNLHKHVKDPQLRLKLTPDYPVGAKRILFSDFYFPALERDNVSLKTDPIAEFTEHGLRDQTGQNEDFDVIIYGTGFQTNPFLADIDVIGLEGKTIREAWSDGAQAYLGVSTSGFPNLHLLYGPNTNLGHTSIIIMLEAQVDYVIQAIEYLDANGLTAVDVKADVEVQYNQELQSRLSKMAFSLIEQSWYKDGNKITNNWAGGTKEYCRRLRQVDWNAYSLD